MPKNSREQIDADEKKVIEELQKNSKESIDKIAKKCGFSRQKVWRVIKKLEKNKTIWGYYTVIDNEKVDMKRYIMLVKRSNVPLGDTIDKIIDLTMHSKGEEMGVNIRCSSYIHGLYDWMFIFTASDIKIAKKFSELLIKEYQQAISEIHLLEDIFSVKKCGIVNPDMKKFREYFYSNK